MKIIIAWLLIFTAADSFSVESNVITDRGEFAVVMINGFRKKSKSCIQVTEKILSFSEEKAANSNKSFIVISNINNSPADYTIPIDSNGAVLTSNISKSDRVRYYYSREIPDSSELHPDMSKLFHLITNLKKKSILLINLDSDHSGVGIYDFGNINAEFLEFCADKIGVFPYADSSGVIEDWCRAKKSVTYITLGTDFYTSETEEVISYIFDNDFSYLIPKKKNSENESFGLFNKYLLRSLPQSVIMRAEKTDDFIKIFHKLKTDDELLLLVNKQNYLEPDYIPSDLADITSLFPVNREGMFLRRIIFDDLADMFSDSKEDGVELRVISAYRSYENQRSVFSRWVKAFGEKEASRVSAVPGASQHQLGTAIDFNILSERFEETPAGAWLISNSCKYGFVMSYPKDMEDFTGYKYEPWHYRYVGKTASYIICEYFNNNLELFLRWYWSLRSY